jgi:hypothetical protein
MRRRLVGIPSVNEVRGKFVAVLETLARALR